MTESKLVQTKSSFTLKGIVSNMSGEHSYREDEIKQGKHKGKQYRSINFLVQTSETNKIKVEMFGMELDYVYPYKKGKKGQKGHTIKNHPFSKRDDLPAGYTLIGINVGLEQDDKGKNIRQSLVDYDAVEYIYDNLNDGDSVYVSGEIQFSSYKNSEDEEIDQVKYIIKQIFHEKTPIDFTDEKFEEVAFFEQEIVFTGAEVVKEEKAVYVTGYTIAYGDKFNVAQFVVRPDGDKDIEKTAKAFSGKKINFGDTMKVFGLCLNKAETIEIEDDGKSKADSSDMFGGKKPKGMDKETFTKFTSELQITGAEDYKAKTYTEEDFVVEEEEELVGEEKDSDDPFGGGDDIDEDDLPF